MGPLTVHTHDRARDPDCLACRDTRLGPDHQPCGQCADLATSVPPPGHGEAAPGGGGPRPAEGGVEGAIQPTTPTVWHLCFAEAAAEELSRDQFSRISRQASLRADARMHDQR